MRDNWLHIAILRVTSAIGCCCSKKQLEDVENPVVVNELISHNIQLQPVNPPKSKIYEDFITLDSNIPIINRNESIEIDKSEIKGMVSILCTYELNSLRDKNDVVSNKGCVMTLGECDVRGIPYTLAKDDLLEEETSEPIKPYTNLPKNFDLISNSITAECADEVVNSTMDILKDGEI